MATNESPHVDWNAIIGRCLAYLCLKNSKAADSAMVEQAAFLQKLGLPLEDQAGVIGTTSASLRELMRQAKQKGGTKKNAKKQRRR